MDLLFHIRYAFRTLLRAPGFALTAIFTLALGMTWGVGTILMLFYNGIMLGGVAVDYIRAGQTKFLLGWLMPHGVIEIPAILIAGQAGLLLALALIGWGRRTPLKTRLREISGDIVRRSRATQAMPWHGLASPILSLPSATSKRSIPPPTSRALAMPPSRLCNLTRHSPNRTPRWAWSPPITITTGPPPSANTKKPSS